MDSEKSSSSGILQAKAPGMSSMLSSILKTHTVPKESEVPRTNLLSNIGSPIAPMKAGVAYQLPQNKSTNRPINLSTSYTAKPFSDINNIVNVKTNTSANKIADASTNTPIANEPNRIAYTQPNKLVRTTNDHNSSSISSSNISSNSSSNASSYASSNASSNISSNISSNSSSNVSSNSSSNTLSAKEPRLERVGPRRNLFNINYRHNAKNNTINNSKKSKNSSNNNSKGNANNNSNSNSNKRSNKNNNNLSRSNSLNNSSDSSKSNKKIINATISNKIGNVTIYRRGTRLSNIDNFYNLKFNEQLQLLAHNSIVKLYNGMRMGHDASSVAAYVLLSMVDRKSMKEFLKSVTQKVPLQIKGPVHVKVNTRSSISRSKNNNNSSNIRNRLIQVSPWSIGHSRSSGPTKKKIVLIRK